MPLAADVANADAISTAVADFAARADGLDALVNCAGVLLPGAVVSFSFAGLKRYPLDHWDQTLAVNLTGLFLCCQAVIEQMLKRRTKGVIVNLSSVSRQGDAGHAAYSAAKGAVASLTQSLAQELKPMGIRCVAIAPGMIDTPMTEQVPAAYRDQMLKRIAVGRLGTPAEVAHAVRFCIENDYFNGRVLELDGGTF
jgi:3-oxoacyl-[acyl-carrier protein] reductase